MVQTRAQIDTSDEKLIEQAYASLWRFAAAVSPWDVEADDLLQEALVRVLQRGPLHELKHPAAYLRRTMLNLAANQARERERRSRALRRLADSNPSGRSDSYPSDLDELGQLSPKARAVVYLTAVEGFGYEEVGRLLGCSEASARMRAMRARRRLRSLRTAEV